MNFAPDETARVKILTAGDEVSLEIKINEYLDQNPDQFLEDIEVEQVEYHARNGMIDFGLIAVLVMKVKRGVLSS